MSGPHLVVVRVSGPGTTGPDRSATTASLLEQSYGDWSVVEGPAPDGDGLPLLPPDPVAPDRAQDVLVVVLPEGARLALDALERLADTATGTGARLLTWDLQLAGTDEPVPALRFGWSPETLLSADYTEGCFALARADYLAAYAALGQVAPTAWSLLLRLPVDLAPTSHLPRTLATAVPSRPVPDEVAAAVIDAGLRFRGVPAVSRREAGVTRLDWQVERWPSVTLMVPSRHNEPLLDPLLSSLRATAEFPGGPRFDLLMIDNGGRTPEHEAFYGRDWGFDVDVLWWEETPFHYGRVNNAAAARTGSEFVVLLNDDTRVLEPGWLAELLGLASLPGVGCAGSALLHEDGKLQHAGVWLGLGGYAGHLFGGLAPGDQTLLGPTSWYRNTLAVTAACLCIRRETYQQLGGLDERMVLCGSDVTLGLDCFATGLRNICTPLPGLVHLESVTRSSPPRNDQLVSLLRYQPWHDGGDPYGNPRLSRRSLTPRLKPEHEPDPVQAARASFGLVL